MSVVSVVSTSGPEEFVAKCRTLIGGLAVDMWDPSGEELSDWEKVYSLAAVIPEVATAEDTRLYFAVAVLMLAEHAKPGVHR